MAEILKGHCLNNRRSKHTDPPFGGLAGLLCIGYASIWRIPNNLAGVEGVEPANAGIKIRCLNQLGDTPTQVSCQTFNLSANLKLVSEGNFSSR